jgi:hypothetical protein
MIRPTRMAAENFTISCPACKYQLTLSTSYAGVTGPCPTCRTLFQVPFPYPHNPGSALPPSYPAPIQQQAYYPPQMANSGGYYMTPQGPYYLPNPYYPPPTSYPPSHPYPYQAPALPAPAPSPPPAERKIWQNRSSIHGQPATKRTQERILNVDTESETPTQQRRSRRKNAVNRPLMPILFVVGAIGLILGIRYLLMPRAEPTKPVVVASATSGNPTPKTIAGNDTDFTSTTPLEPPPALPDGMPAMAQGKAAIEVLEKFFAAKSLAERLPYMETQTPEAELATSVLAGPLPTVVYLELDTQDSNPIEQLMDYYHNVDFQVESNQVSQQTLLVRTRGQSPPKVVVDPFLDSYGGRLLAYSKAPSEKAGIFQVIISAIASCNDERIPFPEKKFTLKLLPRDGAKEITRAYFGRQSKIAQMLQDGTYSFNYGSAKACTVMLRWNTEDDSDFPYLEAIDLKAQDWNP